MTTGLASKRKALQVHSPMYGLKIVPTEESKCSSILCTCLRNKKSTRKNKFSSLGTIILNWFLHFIFLMSPKKNSVHLPIKVSTFISLGKIYIENIPLTLETVTDVPFPDALHFYSQSLQGFHYLASNIVKEPFPILE